MGFLSTLSLVAQRPVPTASFVLYICSLFVFRGLMVLARIGETHMVAFEAVSSRVLEYLVAEPPFLFDASPRLTCAKEAIS